MPHVYRRAAPWFAVLPTIAVMLFVVTPTLNIVGMSLRFDSLEMLFTETTRRVLWFTTWQALLSAMLVLLIALPIAAITSNFRFIGRRALISLVSVPFVLPTVVVGAAFLQLLPASLHRSATAIVVAHVYFNVGLAVRIIGARWEQIHPYLDDAARTLGASTIRTFLTVTLPLLRTAIISASLLVFVMCFTSYGVVRILGGPARSTIETEIYFRAMQLGDISGALVLSILQVVVIGILIALIANASRATNRNRNSVTQLVYSRLRHPRSITQKMIVTTIATMSALGVAVPLVLVATSSVLRNGVVDITAWRNVLTDSSIFGSLTTSLRYAIITIIVATTIGLLGACTLIYGGAHYRFISVLTALPIVVSAVTLGLGIIVTFDVTPIDWRGAWLMMPLAHSLVAIPVVMRVISPVLRDVPSGLRDASRTLGASAWQMWRTIDLHIIRRALVTSAALACAVSLGEFGASSFLVRRTNETLPLTIARLLARPGDLIQAQAYALATVLIVACVGIILVVDRLGTRHRGF